MKRAKNKKNKQTKDAMIIAWIDLFHIQGKDYLVVIEYYSNFPGMALLPSASSTCVITLMQNPFLPGSALRTQL